MLRFIKWLFFLGCAGALAGVLLAAGILAYYANHVPDFHSLEDYNPAQITKVYAADGTLLAEYAQQRRIYTPIKRIPQDLINAFIAAEDTNFYSHRGFDPKGILRAALVNTFTSHKQGASTITQQVAKTFLLSNERTYTRKIKELILAYRIEKALTKDEILELYLNQIYLGAGAYGVAAAAQTYFDKPLDELTLEQRAMLAGLPKAPSGYDPIAHPDAARLRRDTVLHRMEEVGFITHQQAEDAMAKPLELDPQPMASGEKAPYFAEYVRRWLIDKYGPDYVYTAGLKVYTTLNLKMQADARDAVRDGLRTYDRRHGWRGPIGKITEMTEWPAQVDAMLDKYSDLKDFAIPAVVLKVNDKAGDVAIGLPQGHDGLIALSAMKWARKYEGPSSLGPKITKPSDVVAVGDVVLVAPLRAKGRFSLEQAPQVQSGLLSIDNRTGAIRAMVGGFAANSAFNRAVQARRQPGSSFKPIVYTDALEKGYTAASIVLDAPVVMRSGNDVWKPQNYGERIYGPTRLRRGLEESRNLMTIRLAQNIGVRDIIHMAGRFGLDTDGMLPDLSTALGAASVSLYDMTSAYTVFPNLGKKIKPYFIDKIEDGKGRVIFGDAAQSCTGCTGPAASPLHAPGLLVQGQQIISPEIAYVMTDLMRGVVREGTGRIAQAVGHPVAAKTGTTNDYVDGWFMGFSRNFATGVWVGFDQPQTMGRAETGARTAGPIWTEYMKDILAHQPQRPFNMPEDMVFTRIDAATGQLPGPHTKRTILEVFVKGTEPGAAHPQGTPGALMAEPDAASQPGPLQSQDIY